MLIMLHNWLTKHTIVQPHKSDSCYKHNLKGIKSYTTPTFVQVNNISHATETVEYQFAENQSHIAVHVAQLCFLNFTWLFV